MVAVIQFNTPDIEEYASIGSEINSRYCRRHGYEYIREVYAHVRMHPSHEKLFMLKRYLRKHDWLVWIDSDACVINHSASLQDFISTDKNLVTGGHELGFNLAGQRIKVVLAGRQAGINAGVLIFRSCPWTQYFLDSWIGLCKLGYAMKTRFYEQGILQWMLIENIGDLRENIDLVEPASRINRQDFAGSSEMDMCQFILHLWGGSHEQRVDAFSQVSKGIKPGSINVRMPTFNISLK